MLCSDPKGQYHVINLCVPLAFLPFLSFLSLSLFLFPLSFFSHTCYSPPCETAALYAP